MRAICLFPAMHHVSLYDDRVTRIVETVAQSAGAAVFIHCGRCRSACGRNSGYQVISTSARQPVEVSRLALAFPSVPFIIPHFGAGLFREALMAADLCPNIYFDTSSTNRWIRYTPGLTLAEAFRTAISIAGASRLLFGTDSSFFPRGWQRPIYEEQKAIVVNAHIGPADAGLIFGGNFDRLFRDSGSVGGSAPPTSNSSKISLHESDSRPRIRRSRGDEARRGARSVTRSVPRSSSASRRLASNPVDTTSRTGTYARKPPLPVHSAHDIGGIVEAAGGSVTRFKKGDRVYAFAVVGRRAELAVCEEWQAMPLPDQVAFQQGAAIGVPLWHGVARAVHPRPTRTPATRCRSRRPAAVSARRPCRIARAHGLRVLGTAGTRRGTEAGSRAGRTRGVQSPRRRLHGSDPRRDRWRGVDVVLEMLANVNLDRDLDLTRLRGRVVVIGNRGRSRSIREGDGQGCAILGMTLFNADAEEFREIHAGLVAGLENGTLRPVIGKELPLERRGEGAPGGDGAWRVRKDCADSVTSGARSPYFRESFVDDGREHVVRLRTL
jgi:NADPH:quinone reductase-like Zn-dependent oxidoreductase